MRGLVSGVVAVLVPLGVLAGLGQAIHAARPDLGAAPRATSLHGALLERGQAAVAATESERVADAPLPAPRPSVAVRVLTLDLTDPWQPVPVALRRPAWTAVQEQHAMAYGDHAAALWTYDEREVDGAASDRWSSKLADYDLTVATREHYAYIAAGDAGLRILDYTAPASGRRERSIATPGAAEAVLIAGDQAYVVVRQPVPAYSGYD
jgi:hypothetical protein